MATLSTWAYRAAWAVILIVALSMSAWSMYVVAVAYGVPPLLAAGASTTYDGAALICAVIAQRYAMSPWSGAAPRLLLAGLLGCSIVLNVEHARMAGLGAPAALAYAAPACVAVALFEIERGWSTREARRAAGTAPMPRLGVLVWARYPARAFGVVSAELAGRLDAVSARPAATATERPAERPLTERPAERPAAAPDQVETLAALPTHAARVRHAAAATGATDPAALVEWLDRHGQRIGRETVRSTLRRGEPAALVGEPAHNGHRPVTNGADR